MKKALRVGAWAFLGLAVLSYPIAYPVLRSHESSDDVHLFSYPTAKRMYRDDPFPEDYPEDGPGTIEIEGEVWTIEFRRHSVVAYDSTWPLVFFYPAERLELALRRAL